MDSNELYREAHIRFEKLKGMGLSQFEAISGVVDYALGVERDRCAGIARRSAIPGHSVAEPLAMGIAKKIAEGA